MGLQSIHDLAVDLDQVRRAIGDVPRVAYEAAHVYPLSAPRFTPQPGAAREMPPGGPTRLYVHVPFCRYACTFCFYAKRIGSSAEQMRRYVEALRRELDSFAEEATLEQIYVGGGTPTALPPELLDELLALVSSRLSLDPSGCHTVEGSPESLVPAHLEVLHRRGIGRVSLGVQTLDESLLQSVNRRHSAREALDSCRLLVDSGFAVNVDLIYGFPGQSEECLRRDLEEFAALGPQSITLYNLRLNEYTPLARVVEEVERIDLATLMRWRRFAEQTARELGYEQSRWHTFVRRDQRRPGHDRAPGMNAFGIGRELGIGVSAFSHLGEIIYRNHAGFDAYVERVEAGQSPVEDVFPLGPVERRTLFVARTLGDGRSLLRSEYAQAIGGSLDHDLGRPLERLANAGLVQERDDGFVLTDVGRLVYDLVTLAFYPDDTRQWLDTRQEPLPLRRSTSIREKSVPSV